MAESPGTETLAREVEELGLARGFIRVGFARAEALEPEGTRLREWLAAGRHGGMEYMPATADVRADPTHPKMLSDARSVIVFAAPYAGREEPPRIEPGRVARYARGRDYHEVLYDRLRPITRLLRARGHHARAAVDSMPVFERAWAQRAGVGFVGKNCCLIVPGVGSHVFLAAIVTSAELPPSEPMPERCGECRRCLDACPTRAFRAAHVLDARRCISYLTIEHRGSINEELREPIGSWLFGCDACQDVCPFNHGKGLREVEPMFSHAGREPADAARLLAMSEDEFRTFSRRSPLRRAGREGLLRNAALVLGNTKARYALPVLQRAASEDASEVVRDAARWAIVQLESDAGAAKELNK